MKKGLKLLLSAAFALSIAGCANGSSNDDKTIKILRENNICDRFDIIFEERENKHSHVWIIPRYAWMNEICDRIIKNIGTILDYAKKNFRTRDVYEQISQITKIVKKNFASKKYN